MVIKVSKQQFKQWSKREPSKATIAHKARKGAARATEVYKDAVWRGKVKANAGHRCEKSGTTRGLCSHHIFTRSNKAVRHYPPNGCCLTAGLHEFFAHKRPHEFRDWIISVRGQAWWDDLVAKANIRGKERFE